MRMGAALLTMACVLLFHPQARAETLFAQFGQRPGLEKLVDSAAAIWTSDPRVAATFDNTNIPRFKRLLVEQLCRLTGGGCAYKGRNMREAHKGLHLDTRQFNALVEDLQAAMDRVDIPFSIQNRLLALLAPMHRDVVTQ